VKRLVLTFAVLVLFASGCSGGDVGSPTAATVNGTDISMSTLYADLDVLASDATVRASFEQSGTQVYGSDNKTYSTTFAAGWLTQLIQAELIEQQLVSLGGAPTASETKQAQEQVTQSGGTLPEDFVQRLTDTGANQLALQRILDEQAAAQLSPDDVRAFYDENIEAQMQQVGEVACADVASVAFDPTGQSATGTPEQEAAARATIDQIANRVAAGEDLVTVTNEIGQSSPNSIRGGDLSCFARSQGELPAEVVDAAFSLPVGQLSEPLAVTGGLALIQVRSRGVLPFEESEATIRQQLGQQRGETVKQEFLQGASITVDPRFGTFDAESSAVVPPEGPSSPSTTVPILDQLQGGVTQDELPAESGAP
jgi:parvulin-like peptidyl-prolyl isomerase